MLIKGRKGRNGKEKGGRNETEEQKRKDKQRNGK